MKKLYRFFIFIFLSITQLSGTFANATVLFPGTLSINLSRSYLETPHLSKKVKSIADSLKFRSSKLRDPRIFKSNFIFLVPKSSFYNKYLLSTLGSNSTNFKKIDTTSFPFYNNLSNIRVSSPIHDEMILSYSLVQENLVTAKIFSVLGNEITTLFSERQNPGNQIKSFNIADKVSSGIYILRLTVGSQRVAKRIQVL